MLPSTRTPEGDPFECDICGEVNAVDYSHPPGDTLCPACGCHAWSVSTVDFVAEKRAEVENCIQIVRELCRRGAPTLIIGTFVTNNLFSICETHGAAFWIVKPRRWYQWRGRLERLANIGRLPSRFINEIVRRGRNQIRIEPTSNPPYVRLGVPLFRENLVIGVIELQQRYHIGEGARRGYLQLLNQIARIVEPYVDVDFPRPTFSLTSSPNQTRIDKTIA